MEKPKDESVIQIEHLKKSFGSNQVLVDINLNIQKGENVVVLGKSGSGKSVLIKCIVGLINADEGILKVFDNDINGLDNDALNALRKKIGFLFQSGALYDSMSVKENLAFPLRDLKDLTSADKQSRIEEALTNVGLLDVIDKTPSELSGGMRKRLGLARTLILKPEIMLYDEPTTGLDPITSKEISELILTVQKQYNTSSIIITHDMACAKITANRIVIFKEGKILTEGTYQELEKSDDAWVKSFFI
jgi:phospholipid/cholesterol/gamma-HCH transport system ATP-binding protein